MKPSRRRQKGRSAVTHLMRAAELLREAGLDKLAHDVDAYAHQKMYAIEAALDATAQRKRDS